MRYDGTNLEKVLKEHEKYLDLCKNGDPPVEHLRADFSNMKLKNVDFSIQDLRYSNFSNSEIIECNYMNTLLNVACFQNAVIKRTTFKNTLMNITNFKNTILESVCFQYATCTNADLSAAKIKKCNFKNANLSGAINPPKIPMVCPTSGEFIAWKLCIDSKSNNVIVKLLIPKDAKRSSATTEKCRASKAIVLEFQTEKGEKLPDNIEVKSRLAGDFKYRIGQIVEPVLPFEEDRFRECASGIHFFMSRDEAVAYFG